MYQTIHIQRPAIISENRQITHSRHGWYHHLPTQDKLNETEHSARIYLNNPAVVTKVCMEHLKHLEDKNDNCDVMSSRAGAEEFKQSIPYSFPRTSWS